MILSSEYVKACSPFLSGEKPTFASVLLSALVKAYGIQVLDWDGLTIQLHVKEDFNVEMKHNTYDQLMALVTALTTQDVYKNVEVFHEFVMAICGNGVNPYNDVPTVYDVAWAVAELAMNDPEPIGLDPKRKWSRQIRRYIRVVLDDEGMPIAPKALSMATSRQVLPQNQTDDIAMFAGAWVGQQSLADEVDQWVERTSQELIRHLSLIGIVPTKEAPKPQMAKGTKKQVDLINDILSAKTKKAEWTSEANKIVHVDKHQAEFGSPEEYLKTEQELSSTPPDDVIAKDVRCKIKPDGTADCSMSYHSPSKNVLFVKRLADGKTVTLYRPNKSA
jgi:hypothetical protein